jgi:hypothetical protein
VKIDELWRREAPEVVRVGEVVDATGRPLDLQRLIMRRWGWPKASASKAAEWLEVNAGHDAQVVDLPINGSARHELQTILLERVPGLSWDLLEGIANRAHREVRDADRPVSSFRVSFVEDTSAGRVSRSVTDEGMLTGILNVVAGRLGVTMDDLRERADFTRDGAAVEIVIWIDED